ncbi:hypothetical protein [Actinoplanes sp. NPDC049681]
MAIDDTCGYATRMCRLADAQPNTARPRQTTATKPANTHDITELGR